MGEVLGDDDGAAGYGEEKVLWKGYPYAAGALDWWYAREGWVLGGLAPPAVKGWMARGSNDCGNMERDIESRGVGGKGGYRCKSEGEQQAGGAYIAKGEVLAKRTGSVRLNSKDECGGEQHSRACDWRTLGP